MNKISRMIKDEKDINYDILKQIEQHARGYETAVDKKEFLKDIGAYEQKLILLNSSHPYEVLCYLSELDLPATKLILSELNYDEISKILDLFTVEDKRLFYKTFSDLDLVNQFITYDKNASEYIQDLSIDRKIDLLNSSDSETVLASSKVLDSISTEDKQKVIDEVKTADGVSALSNSYSYSDLDSLDNNENDNIISQDETSLDILQEVVEGQEIIEQEDLMENNQEITQLDSELKEKIDQNQENLKDYKLPNPELNDLDNDIENIDNSLSPELNRTIKAETKNIEKPYLQNNDIINKTPFATVENHPEKAQIDNAELTEVSKAEEFQALQKQTEEELIQNIMLQQNSKVFDLEENNILEQLDSAPLEFGEQEIIENVKTL